MSSKEIFKLTPKPGVSNWPPNTYKDKVIVCADNEDQAREIVAMHFMRGQKKIKGEDTPCSPWGIGSDSIICENITQSGKYSCNGEKDILFPATDDRWKRAANINHQIGQRMRELRQERGLTQDQLSKQLLKSIETISNMERGKTMPSLYTLEKFCQVVGVTLGEFFLGLGINNTPTQLQDWK